MLRAATLTGLVAGIVGATWSAPTVAGFAGPVLGVPLLGAQCPAEQAEPQRMGRLFRISLPITGKTYERLQQAVLKVMTECRDRGLRPVLVFEFSVAKDEADFGGVTRIGNAYDLANFLSGDQLNGAMTVAYVPQTIQGHAVLPVLACDQIMMAADADLGPAGVDEKTITATTLTNYREIAARRKRVPPEVAMKLVDRSRALLEVETDVGIDYTTPEGLPALRARRTIVRQTELFPAGQEARFSGAEARKKDFVNYLASSRLDVARALELPPESLRDDAAAFGQWRAARVEIKGPINAATVSKAQRMIREAINREDANFICLWIDSAGGSLTDSLEMTYFLAERSSSKVRTVAYIPKEARADAALIAFGCDEVVVHPQTHLGGQGNYNFTEDEIRQVTAALRDRVAPRKSRSWSLPAAMIDPNLTVFRYTLGGEAGYFCEQELAQQPKPQQWVKSADAAVTTPGKPFAVSNGADAVELRLAAHQVSDFAHFKELYGLENDPTLLEPGWADVLVAALARWEMAVLLLIVGGVSLYVELHTGGLGVGGFIALVCFALFFWSRFLDGTAEWLEIVLFVAGLGCVLVEIFLLPGFGIFGLGGGFMIIASVVLASQTFSIPHNQYQATQFRNSLLVLVTAGGGITVAILLLNRWLPRTPYLGRLVLEPPTEADGEVGPPATHDDLVGTRGEATTPLVPCGKARLGGNLVDVMTDGNFVARGGWVEVVEVQGNRIVVRPVDEP